MKGKKKKKGLDKSQASKVHFKKSFLDRFGIAVNRHDIRELVSDINSGCVIESEALSNRVSAYTMVFMKKMCVILYDEMRKVPVTALTLDMEYKSYSGSTTKNGTVRMFR